MYRYDFRERPDRADQPRTWLSPGYINETSQMIERIAGLRPHPPAWAHDLMQIARAVYLTDKVSLRAPSVDGWTRDIDLAVELYDPEPWQPLTSAIGTLLGVLTSDRWQISVKRGGPGWQESFDSSSFRPDEVALFSGGLDSTAYLADVAQRSSGGPTLLAVSHCHNHDKHAQDRVWPAIVALASPGRLDRVTFRQLPHVPPEVRRQHRLGYEGTTRSRGFLLVAAAVYAAAANGVTKVAIPENGQLAVNPPLSPDRVGGCSTRTVHPLSLRMMNDIIRRVGGDVEVYNPLWSYTKVEVCEIALRSGLGGTDLATTLSCSRASASQRSRGRHCGCCWACLVRRAALTAVLDGNDPTTYQSEPWTDQRAERQAELRALFSWLETPFTSSDLTKDLRLPSGAPTQALLGVISRGRTDLLRMLDLLIPPGATRYRAAVERLGDQLAAVGGPV
ncbi:7-cyano-7-deazaguanine synthase [Micromonospora sp. NPDC050397]|uniref:7-cyano-7-deazaguanine synthase n=1 Tax=Micromonospora sp. NPDC050397 TaxID=3364279 RepID=UPI00384BEC49